MKKIFKGFFKRGVNQSIGDNSTGNIQMAGRDIIVNNTKTNEKTLVIKDVERYHIIRGKDGKMMATHRLNKEDLEKLINSGNKLDRGWDNG